MSRKVQSCSDDVGGSRQFGAYLLLAAIALGMLILATVLAPWVIRNMRTMGEPILLRDNFGLELAIANYPGAMHPKDPLQARNARIEAIHPFKNHALRSKIEREGGEASYSRNLGSQAKRWIRENPRDFIALSARHLAEFYFPRPWQFAYTGSGKLTALRSAIVSLVSALGLFGLLIGVRFGGRRYMYVALVVLVPALPYAVVEPVPRYTYLVYGLLVYLAADLTARVILSHGKLNRAYLADHAIKLR